MKLWGSEEAEGFGGSGLSGIQFHSISRLCFSKHIWKGVKMKFLLNYQAYFST